MLVEAAMPIDLTDKICCAVRCLVERWHWRPATGAASPACRSMPSRSRSRWRRREAAGSWCAGRSEARRAQRL